MSRLFAVISLFLIFISLALIYLNLSDNEKLLTIRLDTYRNATFLGTKNDVLKIGLVGEILVLINIVLARILQKKYKFVSDVFSAGTVFLAILILIIISGIIIIN